ncbi:probable inactive receptor kinase [Tanacetum coccineum]|uniref:Probable inactive receptor kinase n=1 Tax=Tanacetum coccineum TaxID=301880 RepID=A0ABQ4WYR1_9ASTR
MGFFLLTTNAINLENDKTALLDFMHNLPHSRSLNWDINSSLTSVCTQWTGVTCNEDMTRVIGLRLPGVGFHGHMPKNTISRLSSLQILSLRSNGISGEFPVDFFNLKNLSLLYLQFNQFEGELPKDFTVTIVYGKGEVPIVMPPKANMKTGRKVSEKVILGIVLGVSVIGLVGFAIFWVMCCVKRDNGDGIGISSKIEKGGMSPEKAISRTQDANNRLVFFEGCNYAFDLEDLLRASAEVLGKGTFGMSYKAILEDGTSVVVKRLKELSAGKKEFETQMGVVGSIKHENVVELRAYYYSKDEKLTVCEYYSQGSVAAMLHGKRGEDRVPLDWETRLRIAIGAARGIARVHTEAGCKLVHGNIKSSNIFLNSQSYGCVSDIGLSSIMSQIATPIARAAGYRAPELTDTRKVTQPSDVYSFGVLLLELLTGKSPVHTTSGDEVIHLVRWVHSVVREEWTGEVFDVELLKYPNIEEEMVEMLQIAMSCVARVPDQRPKMTEVVKMVEDVRRSTGSENRLRESSTSPRPETLSKQGDWFSFAKREGPTPVCMEGVKSDSKLWKEKIFLIDRKAIPFHIPWRHPDSCITDRVPTSFNKGHIDQLKAHIVKLCDIPEGVLVRSRLSRVWRNPMCDPVLRLMSIYDFLCMPSLDKVTVREEPHELDTSILDRVADCTRSPAPAGTAIPLASLGEIAVTRPDRKVVTKADHVAKRKVSTGPKISTNAANKTRSNKKGSGAGSSGNAAGDEVKQTDDGTLDDDDQRDGSEFAMEGIESLNDVSKDKKVEPHAELSGDADDGGNGSDVNVDPYHEAQVGTTAGDVLERDLLPLVPGPYYILYPYDEGSDSDSPLYIKDDWEEIHGVNLGLHKKELYKDHKVCRNALDRFPTPAETHQLRELYSVELSDRMSMLQCQLITHGSMLNARYDHSLKNVDRLTKQCSQQRQIIKKKNADIKQQSEFIDRANEEVSRLTAQLGVLKSRCQTTEQKLSSWDKKHRKYRNERDTLAMEKAKIVEELSDFTSLIRRFLKNGEFNRAFASLLNMAISVRVERGLRMDHTDKEFRELSQRVDGFILDAKEKFDRAVVAFPATTFLFLYKLSRNSQSSL